MILHLPHDKIIALAKLKAFTDNKLNVTQNIERDFYRVQNIVEKVEDADNQHFLLFPQCFRKASSSGVSKVIIVWVRVNMYKVLAKKVKLSGKKKILIFTCFWF